MTFLARYRKLNLWSKLGAWGSVASIIGLAWLFVPQTPAPEAAQTKTQTETVTSSPGATLIQSGRDTIINNPPPKTVPDAPGEGPSRGQVTVAYRAGTDND
jgi:hypothetical protein